MQSAHLLLCLECVAQPGGAAKLTQQCAVVSGGGTDLSKAVGMKRVFAEVAKHDEKVAAGLVKRPATSAAAPAVKLTPQQALEAKSSQAHYSTNQVASRRPLTLRAYI